MLEVNLGTGRLWKMYAGHQSISRRVRLVISHATRSVVCIIQTCNNFLGLPERSVLLCALTSPNSLIDEKSTYSACFRLLKIPPQILTVFKKLYWKWDTCSFLGRLYQVLINFLHLAVFYFNLFSKAPFSYSMPCVLSISEWQDTAGLQALLMSNGPQRQGSISGDNVYFTICVKYFCFKWPRKWVCQAHLGLGKKSLY